MARTSLPWWVSVVAAAALASGATYMSDCGHNDRDLVQRVSALEAHRKDDNERLGRMESKLNDLWKWALGK